MRICCFFFVSLMLLVISVGCSSPGADNPGGLAQPAQWMDPGPRDVSALNWSAPVVVDSRAWGGNSDRSSLAIVGGNPAIAYYVWNKKTSKYSLCYKRATNSTGTAWGAVKTIAVMGSYGAHNTYLSLAIVNGHPAICYQDVSSVTPGSPSRELMYVRAKDATGNKWGTPVTVVGEGDAFGGLKLVVVNGNPAISFTHILSGQRGKYIRALDANGSAWGPLVTLDDSGTIAVFHSLAIVNGRPAVGYAVAGPVLEVRYIRAGDANGDNWGSPQTVLFGGDGPPRLIVVNGSPAFVMSGNYLSSSSRVSFMRALDSDGTTWPAEPLILDGAGNFATIADISVINGLPAVAYVRAGTSSGPYTLSFMQALDADGAAWGTAEDLVDLGSTKAQPSLAEVASGAGIAYWDGSHAMNFLRGQ